MAGSRRVGALLASGDPPAFPTTLRQTPGVLAEGPQGLAATQMVERVMRGAPLKSVQELLGHATIEMTMRYSHSSSDARRDAVRLLDIKERVTLSYTTSTGTGVVTFPAAGRRLLAA